MYNDAGTNGLPNKVRTARFFTHINKFLAMQQRLQKKVSEFSYN